jgi:hypothetical protein
MARWNSQITSWTPVAYADTVAMATVASYHNILAGSATQRVNVIEVYEGGQATASNANWMVFARLSTITTTPALGANAKNPVALDSASAALAAPPTTVSSHATGGQRSSTLYLLNLSFNAFGGLVRWVAAPGEEINMTGTAATTGEMGLSAFTGSATGLLGTHFVIEPF